MLRGIFFAFMLAVCVIAEEIPPATQASFCSSKDALQSFQASIDKIIAQHAGNCHVGVEIVSMKNGMRLYQKNAEQLFIPASCLKVFTAAAALSILGPDFQMATGVFTDGYVEDGVVHGNLFLKGGGDPELEIHHLQEMAQTLCDQGITSITGSVYVDHTDFDGISQGPGWMWDDAPRYWNSPMDALTVNHSCIRMSLSPGAAPASLAEVVISPNTGFVQIHNTLSTTEDRSSQISISRIESLSSNILKIEGAIKKDSQPLQAVVALAKPHLYAGHIFAELLSGCNLLKRQGSVAVKKIPSNAILLVSHSSRPMNFLLQKMVKESDNLYADCIFKKIGQCRYDAKGTWSRGSRAVREFLASFAHIDTSAMVVLDGSGLSRYNLVSPRQFTQFLKAMTSSPYFPDFLAALSISGVDGTLKSSLHEPELKTKVRAKSGGMQGVKNLCGYVVTKDQEMLAFSIMTLGFIEPRANEHKLENEICKFLVGYEKEKTFR